MKIRRLLVANRGEIARRILRTAHRLGVETVAVHSRSDARALHVREATLSHALGGDAPADSYLHMDRVLAAARATHADAVHPGYGFLSESPEFAQAVADAGLLWVGPPPQAMRMLASKPRAKQLAHARDIPCLEGYHGEDQSEERLVAAATMIGFPLMVKAAAGGGGRGMRLVSDPAQLLSALRSARSEAQSAFGCGDLLLERALPEPRHVEVQVFADLHGNCVYLGERDCSVQRRHQKIIEEAPSPAVDPALRRRLGECAVELARAAGYAGAGTVEFLLEGDRFWFMEMNTRLQVEHPVTEAVTGHDLVEWQLRIACGERLPCRQSELALHGHAIEVRLCAEDENFVPQSGRVLSFLPPPGWGGGALRFDHALEPGSEVPPFYDSLLGKLIARAPTRAEAIAQLVLALDRLHVLGLPTNRRLLAACLRHPVFAAGEARTSFLARYGDEIRDALEEEELGVAAEAAFSAVFPRGAPPALASPFVRPLRVRHRGAVLDMPVCEAEGLAPAQAQCVALAPGRWHVQCGAVDLFLQDASFEPPQAREGSGHAHELRAPFNGKVIAVHAQPGSAVAAGNPLVVIESMKLEHVLAAPRNAVVEAMQVETGQQVASGQLLVTFVRPAAAPSAAAAPTPASPS